MKGSAFMKYFSDEKLNDLAMELRKFAEEQARIRNLVFWNILRNKAIGRNYFCYILVSL